MNYFYNNFLSLDKINEVYDTIFNIDFPFFYAHENTVSKPDLNKEEKNFSNILDYYQICHVFYSKYSEYSYIPNMIIEKLNIPNKILRAKVNFQGQNIKATTLMIVTALHFCLIIITILLIELYQRKEVYYYLMEVLSMLQGTL